MRPVPQWYAASVILFVRLKSGRQRVYPVWENVYLVRAASPQAAYAEAEKRGRADAAPDETMRWKGKPAEFVFGGIRKLLECSPDPALPGEATVTKVHSGVEATYSSFLVKSRTDLEKLINGKPVTVLYEE